FACMKAPARSSNWSSHATWCALPPISDTRLMFHTMYNTTRVLRNAISEEVVATERRPGGCTFEEISHLVIGTRGRDAFSSGEVDGGVVAAGQVIGLINDIPSCAELIERMVAECRQHLRTAMQLAQ